MSPAGEILVVSFHSMGHTFPATELSLRLASRGLRVTLFLPTRPRFPLHPNVNVVLLSHPPPPPPAVDPNSSSTSPFPSPPPHLHEDPSVEDYLSKRFGESGSASSASASSSSPPPMLCAVLDSMMSQHIETCRRYGIPVVSFFTSSSCAAALEHAASKLSVEDLAPTGSFAVPGLPEDMPVDASYFLPGPPPPHERPFLDYLAKEAGKPVWGVGPLLPHRFWSTPDETTSDDATRPGLQQQETTVAEGEVRAWLDSQLPASVLYISFGTLVGPFPEELAELAAALEESDRPFIWVLQAGALQSTGYFPEDLERNARKTRRGLVIRGWAPQLAILSHPSTAAFLSHCGWNSTVEALGRGVPVLAWPIKGDQLSNAKLVTERLRVGYPVRTAVAGLVGRVKKEDVARGIERLMADKGIRDRAQTVRSIFTFGFPESSSASIDAFVDFVMQRFKEVSS
ncbi:hypothetical protein Taro_028081 [Colocasia esculenta]|uniref:Glycosyltransferase n=1 Tax=Colocasia esculenta TaxID=4460 RepID=A0A843VQQ8_COLES|nr:hypothetical protein [Colocasia esculenta]